LIAALLSSAGSVLSKLIAALLLSAGSVLPELIAALLLSAGSVLPELIAALLLSAGFVALIAHSTTSCGIRRRGHPDQVTDSACCVALSAPRLLWRRACPPRPARAPCRWRSLRPGCFGDEPALSGRLARSAVGAFGAQAALGDEPALIGRLARHAVDAFATPDALGDEPALLGRLARPAVGAFCAPAALATSLPSYHGSRFASHACLQSSQSRRR
jgi:hypothetical protein